MISTPSISSNTETPFKEKKRVCSREHLQTTASGDILMRIQISKTVLFFNLLVWLKHYFHLLWWKELSREASLMYFGDFCESFNNFSTCKFAKVFSCVIPIPVKQPLAKLVSKFSIYVLVNLVNAKFYSTNFNKYMQFFKTHSLNYVRFFPLKTSSYIKCFGNASNSLWK